MNFEYMYKYILSFGFGRIARLIYKTRQDRRDGSEVLSTGSSRGHWFNSQNPLGSS